MYNKTNSLFHVLLLWCVVFCLPSTALALDCDTGNNTISSDIASSFPPTVTASQNCVLDIDASVTINGSGSNGLGPALLAENDAMVRLLPDGSISANGSGGTSLIPRTAVRLQDDVIFTMLGGSVSAGGSGNEVDRVGIFAEGNATAILRGGAINAAGSGSGVRTEIVAEDSSTIFIFGSGFNFGLGDIQSLSGTVTGTLEDGSPIEWRFARDADARIVLAVPEPSSAILGVGFAMSMLLRRRRFA